MKIGGNLSTVVYSAAFVNGVYAKLIKRCSHNNVVLRYRKIGFDTSLPSVSDVNAS